MLYAAMTFWLLAIVLTAWGVLRLWSQLASPRVINVVLLPGTLVAQVGRVVGLLITGATVHHASLYPDDSGEPPASSGNGKPRIPILGPIVVGAMPLFACVAGILAVARFAGPAVPSGFWRASSPAALPTSVHGVWQWPRDQIMMMERLFDSVIGALPGTWRFWVFIYLMLCLTVRMAPFPGTMRGTIGAIVLLGLVTAGVGTAFEALPRQIQAAWPVLSISLTTLLLVLTASAMARGAVGLRRMMAADA